MAHLYGTRKTFSHPFFFFRDWGASLFAWLSATVDDPGWAVWGPCEWPWWACSWLSSAQRCSSSPASRSSSCLPLIFFAFEGWLWLWPWPPPPCEWLWLKSPEIGEEGSRCSVCRVCRALTRRTSKDDQREDVNQQADGTDNDVEVEFISIDGLDHYQTLDGLNENGEAEWDEKDTIDHGAQFLGSHPAINERGRTAWLVHSSNPESYPNVFFADFLLEIWRKGSVRREIETCSWTYS